MDTQLAACCLLYQQPKMDTQLTACCLLYQQPRNGHSVGCLLSSLPTTKKWTLSRLPAVFSTNNQEMDTQLAACCLLYLQPRNGHSVGCLLSSLPTTKKWILSWLPAVFSTYNQEMDTQLATCCLLYKQTRNGHSSNNDSCLVLHWPLSHIYRRNCPYSSSCYQIKKNKKTLLLSSQWPTSAHAKFGDAAFRTLRVVSGQTYIHINTRAPLQ